MAYWACLVDVMCFYSACGQGKRLYRVRCCSTRMVFSC